MTPKILDRSIRVVVVDDSTTVRELLVALLQGADGIQVVGVGTNGEEAVRLAKRLHPDVMTIDVRMPGVDGLEATRRIMRESPTRIVIVTGNPLQAGKDLTFEALRAGALTVIRAPGLADPESCTRVVQMVRLMSEVSVVHHWGTNKREPVKSAMLLPPSVYGDNDRSAQIIGIAASTGGPVTLAKVLGALQSDFRIPILVVQHITRGFAVGMAEWLDGETAVRVHLAEHGTRLQPGTVLIAPDDYHLQVNARGVVELCQELPYKGLRPSANYLFHSLARAYGPRSVGVVLSGMGDDGAEGLRAIRLAGGLTIAQDEQSCAVYGMPREAIASSVIDHMLTPEQIALTLNHLDAKTIKKAILHE